jgi:ferric enterobactin receptor
VNWFADDPAERLAVLTTFILDPTNPELGLSTADKAEAGVEVSLGGSAFSLLAFRENLSGGVGLRPEPTWLPRDRYAVEATEPGQPPRVIEPPERTDTVPVLVQRPANNTSVATRGVEMTALLPEIRFLRTRLEVNAAWIENEQVRTGMDVGSTIRFREFQQTPSRQRIPYWEAPGRGGRRALATYRLIHQQPELGLVVTATIQHNLLDRVWDDAAIDTLAFAGYLTREGQAVPVPPERRGDPEYADLRQARTGLLVDLRRTPADWMMGLQVSKSLPLDGRLSFWAFNVLDRQGYFVEGEVQARLYPSTRFGLELTLPLRPVLGGRR